jgi:glutathione S-transferase
MKLLQAGASPFARKCRVTLIETGLEGVEVVDVATSPKATDPSVAAANPLGKIPVLVRADGPALHDSRVICRFLDARAGAGLYPEARLWDVMTLEATADGIMDAAVLLTYQGRFGEGEHWIDGQWDKVARALDALEARWIPNLAGPLGMGQIAVGCALGYLDFRHDARRWRDGRPSLAGWEERFRERASMRATAPA